MNFSFQSFWSCLYGVCSQYSFVECSLWSLSATWIQSPVSRREDVRLLSLAFRVTHCAWNQIALYWNEGHFFSSLSAVSVYWNYSVASQHINRNKWSPCRVCIIRPHKLTGSNGEISTRRSAQKCYLSVGECSRLSTAKLKNNLMCFQAENHARCTK